MESLAPQVDAVIYCTGYKISFPFLDQAVTGTEDSEIPLYHRVVPPERPGLYFIGLVQPIGAVMPMGGAAFTAAVPSCPPGTRP